MRAWTPEETDALRAAAEAVGVDPEDALAKVGQACDIHLNDDAVWSGIPQRAWDFKIGGYTVLRKWLSYRDLRVLSRPLRSREASHFGEASKRLTVLTMMTPLLDAHYAESRDSAFPWRTRPARPPVLA